MIRLALLVAACAQNEPALKPIVKIIADKAPTQRYMAAAVFDSKQDRMLVFGGREPESRIPHPSLMSLDLKRDKWKTLKTARSPRFTSAPAMAYVESENALYLFGGWAPDAREPSSELWRLRLGDDETLKWEKLNTTGHPRGRNGLVMVFDTPRNRLIVHGGDGGEDPQFGFTPLADLWAFDLTAGKWKMLEPTGDIPPARWNHSGAVDTRAQKLFLYGGAGLGEQIGKQDESLYSLDLRTLKCTRLQTTGVRPPPMEGTTLTFDSAHHALLLAGGLSLREKGSAGARSVWTLDLASRHWNEFKGELRTTRRDHVAIFEPKFNRHIIYGGAECAERGNFYKAGAAVTETLSITLRPAG